MSAERTAAKFIAAAGLLLAVSTVLFTPDESGGSAAVNGTAGLLAFLGACGYLLVSRRQSTLPPRQRRSGQT
jgi:uncharacterized protein involved in response to NO